MSESETSPHVSTAVLVGDACLFTGATFCVLAVAGGPLALLVGPALAWALHGRKLDGHAIISGLIGLVVALMAVGGVLAGIPALVRALAPAGIGGSEYTGGLIALIAVSAVFASLLIALDVFALRDLVPARREHVRIDVARLVATAVIVVFGVVITVLQLRNPAMEIGDAGVFALAAAAVGAVTMAVGNAIASRPAAGHSDAGSTSGV